jgi:hypothetical protein
MSPIVTEMANDYQYQFSLQIIGLSLKKYTVELPK